MEYKFYNLYKHKVLGSGDIRCNGSLDKHDIVDII